MITLTFARWFIAIVVYLLIISVIVYFKPSMMFESNGNIKRWGTCTDGKYSVFSPEILFPFIAILVYIFVILIELSIPV